MATLPPEALIQDGRIVLYSAPDRDVIHSQAALRHHFFQLSVAEKISQIPPHTQNDDRVLKVFPGII